MKYFFHVKRAIFLIAIFLIVFGTGCAGTIGPKIHPNISYDKFNKVADESGYTVWVHSEYKGYKLIGTNIIGGYVGFAIFNPNDRMVKYIDDPTMEKLYLLSQEERDRYLKNFVLSYNDESSDHSDIAQFDPELGRSLASLDRRQIQWNSSFNEYSQKLDAWNSDYNRYKQKENTFLSNLTIAQLEIYAKYEEAAIGESPAKKELYRRKVVNILNQKQKDDLIYLSKLGMDLNDRREKLTIHKTQLEDENKEIDKKNKVINDYINAKMVSLNTAQTTQTSQPSAMGVLADGLGKMAEDYRRQSENYRRQSERYYEKSQMDYQMWQMNNSLQDISRAIRGF